ncbi:tyrosine-protein phosphatase non-receptor type 2 [Biomphalaria pfeifferi]|uniref:protein-tyrosine-phosphatase n=1 Tax=Biomphalaria pfeifferi TaxID=112525 RepID=A0AAD8F064_BIOPF|nr:tyrosine-protein phosphatase non-receptor type 2 [Biomphalaria pfeifferi]
MASQTEREFAEYDSNNSWNEIFQRLKNEASLLTLGDEYSTKDAREPDNRRKNRYRDVSPYDHSRVKISGECDYINASFIEVPEANRKYILTQGPLDHTMCDFWQMTWEQKSRAVVMLNRVIEKDTWKCSQYWPLGSDYGKEDEMYFPECDLKVTLLSEQDSLHFTLRTLELERVETGDKREVLHFHYTTWPDFGVPSSPFAFLHFLHCVRNTGSLETDVGPAVVHCSAGIGRSGTFCLVDSCLVLVENEGSLDSINVKEMLLQMRSYRMGLIQTSDQLRFSYQAIIQGAHEILQNGSLGSLLFSDSTNQNHLEHPPEPPERTSSLRTELFESEPPPIPPKKRHAGKPEKYELFAEEEESEEEYDNLVESRSDSPDFSQMDSGNDNLEVEHNSITVEHNSLTGEKDSLLEEERAAEERHRIREERKKQTLEKLRQMKERQKKCERWKPYKSYFRPTFYFGLAVLVGVAGVLIYKYMMKPSAA